MRLLLLLFALLLPALAFASEVDAPHVIGGTPAPTNRTTPGTMIPLDPDARRPNPGTAPDSPVALGRDKGEIVRCEGYVDNVVSAPDCDFAKSADHRCTVVTVDKCQVWKQIEYVECLSDSPRPSLVDKFDSFHLKSFAEDEIEIVKELTRKKVKDPNQVDLEHIKRIQKRPKMRVQGVLEDCVITQNENSYPVSQCALSSCTAEFIDEPPAEKKSKKKN